MVKLPSIGDQNLLLAFDSMTTKMHTLIFSSLSNVIPLLISCLMMIIW